ncbi:MAG: DUF4968 domain-containing protein [Spirochaetales bacterium]|nr:DUF4968 domain-containing protein [Spirochaetales bacterium]
MLTARKGPKKSINTIHRTDRALILNTESGNLKLEPYSDAIIRITYTLADSFKETQSPGTIDHNEKCIWSYKEEESEIILNTKSIRLVINKTTCSFAYYDSNGNLLTKEPVKGGKTLISYNAYRSVLDENSLVEKIETPDGIKEIIIDSKKEFYKKLNHTRIEFEWEDGEALFGMGQQEEGVLNLRGSRRYVHQANMKIAMPFIVSTRGYGILLDTYSPIIFNDNEYGSYIYNESAEELDFYFIQGDSFDAIIGGYRFITGKASMLPKWAFGYFQSIERYESQQEIMDTVEEYRRRGVPLDCIVLDWQYWEEGMWGQKSFDSLRFPTPKRMIETLHENGVNFMISIWPNMFNQTENYKEMVANNCLFQHSEIYDAFDDQACSLFWKQVSEGLFIKGVDAWWCDASEPFSPEWNSPIKPEPDQNYLNFHNTAKNYINEEFTNAYSLRHARAIYEGQRGETDEKRVINLTRSGYTGQQKYGTILWSGDISANWKTLGNQIPEGLNMCMSGMPYWTLDIGGFFVKKGDMWFWDGDYEEGCEDLGYRELYTRWLQLGTFLPIFRSHGTDTRREIWNFGKKGETFYDTIVNFINLRYRLLPYIYSMAGMVTLKDYTIMRHLAFDFIDDPRVYDIKDQYMFGNALMICPVTEPMYYSSESQPLKGVSKTRKVYLPLGSDWFDFWTNEKLIGGKYISARASLDIIPVYVKCGAIIPMAEKVLHTGSSSESEIKLVIYPGANGSFKFYCDENNNYNYEQGDYSTIDIEWNDGDKYLTIGERQGSYKDMKEEISFTIVLLKEEQSTLKYNGNKMIYKL